MDYQKQAADFLNSYGIKFSAEYIEHSAHFDDDKKRGVERDIWRLTLKRKGRQMSVTFGQSEADSDHGNTPPRPYDLLSCLTKYDPGTFANFCGDYGYSEDSISGLRTYKAVCREWAKMSRFFTAGELEELQDIA
jgi:hypothetical protein